MISSFDTNKSIEIFENLTFVFTDNFKNILIKRFFCKVSYNITAFN